MHCCGLTSKQYSCPRMLEWTGLMMASSSRVRSRASAAVLGDSNDSWECDSLKLCIKRVLEGWESVWLVWEKRKRWALSGEMMCGFYGFVRRYQKTRFIFVIRVIPCYSCELKHCCWDTKEWVRFIGKTEIRRRWRGNKGMKKTGKQIR